MPEKSTIYHIKDGPAEMWAIDANRALRQHADEWAAQPWPNAKADKGDEDLSKLSAAKLRDLATTEGIAFEIDDNKAALVDKIVAGRKLAAGQD